MKAYIIQIEHLPTGRINTASVGFKSIELANSYIREINKHKVIHGFGDMECRTNLHHYSIKQITIY